MVSIIIAHLKNNGNLEECLKSVLGQTYNPKEIIVINNSGSKTVENYLARTFPMVKLINPGYNLLYSRAHNQGVRNSRGKLLMFLNDDVILSEDFISRLVEGFNKSKDIGMVCGKILRMDRITIDSTGQFLGKDRRPIERGWQQRDRGQYDYFSYTFSPGGVAPLYRREVLEEVAIDGEYFDEDFIIFYEDLDLAWRANRFGWRSFYSPLALAYHHRGASTQSPGRKLKIFDRYYFTSMPADLQVHLLKNRYLTVIKNDSLKYFLLNLASILVYEGKLWLYVLIFRPKLIPALMRNRHCFQKAWRKRKIIKEKLKEKFHAAFSGGSSQMG